MSEMQLDIQLDPIDEKHDSLADVFSDWVQHTKRNVDSPVVAQSDNTCCKDYFLYKIKTLSKSISKNGNLLLKKTKSIQNTKSKSKSNSPNKPDANIITIQNSSGYLRKADFSNVVPASITPANSGYFERLFSPPPQMIDENSNFSVQSNEVILDD